MVPMSVEEIAKAVDGRLIGDAGSESRATNTVSDSRQAGPGSVFVAIRGERVDGHDFVAKTAGQGATVAIVDHEVKSDGLPQIVVKDTVDALGELARYNIVRRRELDGDFDIIVINDKDQVIGGNQIDRFGGQDHHQGSALLPACHRRSDRGSGGIVQQ